MKEIINMLNILEMEILLDQALENEVDPKKYIELIETLKELVV